MTASKTSMEVASTGIQFEELRASYWQRNHHHHQSRCSPPAPGTGGGGGSPFHQDRTPFFLGGGKSAPRYTYYPSQICVIPIQRLHNCNTTTPLTQKELVNYGFPELQVKQKGEKEFIEGK